MRKRIVSPPPNLKRSSFPETWLDLEQTATVKATSEHPNFPSSRFSVRATGQVGERVKKVNSKSESFSIQPISVKRIHLRFVEGEVERTQESRIRWARAQGGSRKEVVRQQWNFSPAGSTSEVEDYEVWLVSEPRSYL